MKIKQFVFKNVNINIVFYYYFLNILFCKTPVGISIDDNSIYKRNLTINHKETIFTCNFHMLKIA